MMSSDSNRDPSDKVTITTGMLEDIIDQLDIVARLDTSTDAKGEAFRLAKKLDHLLHPEFALSKENWERVIDEQFYVQYEGSPSLFLLKSYHEVLDSLDSNQPIRLVRQPYVTQPYFQGHPHPIGDTLVVVFFDYACESFCFGRAGAADWSEVKSFIEIPNKVKLDAK